MKTRPPTPQEIARLVSFLPRLYADGFTPIRRWIGGCRTGNLTVWPLPEYEEVVVEFFREASKDCWTDYDYNLKEPRRMIEDADFVKAADLAQIKTMLTFCVRGERFCDGHWAEMIKLGYIRRLLERLAQLGSGDASHDIVSS